MENETIMNEITNQSQKKQLSIVGPAMNEAGNLKEYVERCIQAFESRNVDGEIIIVDDGSTDDTDSVLQTLVNSYPDILIAVKHRKNLGLTPALQTAFHQSTGEKIIWIPTDLESHPDEDIPLLYEKLINGSDVVAGYRKDRGDGKSFASRIYNLFTRWLFGIRLRDMNWIKGFSRECLPTLYLRSDWHRFMLVMLHSDGFEIKEVETQWYEREYGQSKFGLLRFPRSVLDLLSIWFLIVFSKKPMRLFGFLGALSMAIGLGFHGYLTALYYFYSTQIRPLFWFALTLEIFGIQFILFGFISELLERTRENVLTIDRIIQKGSLKQPINNEINIVSKN